MIYTYEAKDRAGRTVTGSLDALDERAAATQVRDQGYFPTRLVPMMGAGTGTVPGVSAAPKPPPPSYSIGKWLLVHLVYPFWSGVSLNELALCYRQFGAMLHAGVPIYQCLTTLVAQTRNVTFRRILQTIGERVQRGQTLSSAMAEYPWIFTDFHRSMVGAGEMTGGLDTMFMRLSEALEQEMLLRRNIRRETFYPKAVIVCACLLPPLFHLFVPGGGFRAYFAAAIVPLMALLGVTGAIFVINQLGAQWKLPYHTFLAMLPSIGGTVRMIALARFCRSLASLYAAGVAIPRAIQSAAETCGNAFLASRIVRAIPRITAGQGIVESMRDTNVFPPMVMSMLGTGEQTGSLDQTMDHVAEYYEQESVVRLHQTSVTIGVIALIIAGIIVAIDVIGFWKGYGSQYNDLLKPDAD
jgi:type IV pilus assembly protein PilC